MSDLKRGFLIPLVFGLISGFWMSSSAETSPPIPQARRTVLRVGYSSGNFSKGFLGDAPVVLESLGSSIAERTSEFFSGVSATVYDDFQGFRKAIVQDEVDIVIVNSLDYLVFQNEGILKPVLVGSTSRGILQEFVIIIPKNKGITEIGHMAGATVNIEIGGQGRTPWVWFEIFVRQATGSHLSSFFREIRPVGKASLAVLPVFFHKADACVTSLGGFQTMVELNPQLGQELEIIGRSPRLLRGIVCFRSSFEKKYQNAVLKILLEVHEDPEGQQLLIALQEEKLVPFRAEYLETSRKLYRSYQNEKISR